MKRSRTGLMAGVEKVGQRIGWEQESGNRG